MERANRRQECRERRTGEPRRSQLLCSQPWFLRMKGGSKPLNLVSAFLPPGAEHFKPKDRRRVQEEWAEEIWTAVGASCILDRVVGT